MNSDGVFIPDKDIEKALNFYRDSAPEYGRLVGACKGLDHKRKIVQSEIFMEATGTVAERTAISMVALPYKDAVKDLQDAETDKAILQTLLKAAELKIEVWRSLNSRAGRGHV